MKSLLVLLTLCELVANSRFQPADTEMQLYYMTENR
jgi:hypothetical protein